MQQKNKVHTKKLQEMEHINTNEYEKKYYCFDILFEYTLVLVLSFFIEKIKKCLKFGGRI